MTTKPDAKPPPEPEVRTSAHGDQLWPDGTRMADSPTLAFSQSFDRLFDAWLIDHVGTATPQWLSAAAKWDLKERLYALALKET